MLRFAGKTVLITGAGRGIGKAIALRFASEGAALALVSNVESDLLATAEELAATGASVRTFVVDVSDHNQVEAAVGAAVRHFGRIDILVNNAGIAWEEPVLGITPDHWRKIIDVNLNGTFWVAQAVANRMAEQGGGVIVNMASTNGLVGEANYAHYNASKGGVVLLTKTMAIELGGKGIRVNAVCPGYIQTPMSEAIDSPEFIEQYIRAKIPLGRVGKPEDVAGVFAFLASDDAAFITGETIVVDGGQLAF
ncbi:SDR family oxidoreductase [Paenibacillus hemerocallicola]|uniref:SDR family oxidoreductase n=1 Tax=Paenibacillus hemerocallicola TaxID=1172614 RepID=A0A5C4THB3_9BACL|nr:SDR family NAD(P)-dependent oxidoreductase [Paenibacillus hemerocallicola]TNJ68378.1 SDR family oxidoreductase [Paenibacillus hemerocallicola]